jgi:hypothetical protein
LTILTQPYCLVIAGGFHSPVSADCIGPLRSVVSR